MIEESRIPLFVRQSSFSASTPPLSVELLTHGISHPPITPSYPVTRLSFTSPSPVTSPMSNLTITPITAASTPAATPSSISDTPQQTSPRTPQQQQRARSSSSSSSSKHQQPVAPSPGTPIPSRHEVHPIPINLSSSPPGSPANKPRSGSKGASSLPALQIPPHVPPTSSTHEPIPPPPPTPTTTLTTALTQAPTAPRNPSTTATADNAQYARIPPAPLSPPTTTISVQPPTNPTPNVFLSHPSSSTSVEDPALTSLRLQLYQLSSQLADTERLLAESQSRLESALAAPRISESAWSSVLKYFCPTGIFCTTHD